MVAEPVIPDVPPARPLDTRPEVMPVDDQTENPVPTTDKLMGEKPVVETIDAREGETPQVGDGAFRGPYYDFVGRMGPYPQGPTTKGIHVLDEGGHTGYGDDPGYRGATAESRIPPVDDQSKGQPAPTTRDVLATEPIDAIDLGDEVVVVTAETGDAYEPMEPELEPEPGEPGIPVIEEQPGFAHGDPGTGLENIHTPEEPEPEPGPEPTTLAIAAPVDGATVPAVHDVTGSGAAPAAQVTLWYMNEDRQVATTTADASGNWGFTGDEATAPGEATYEVRSEGSTTASVTVTVEEQAPAREGEGGDWSGFRTHAELDDYLEGRGDLSRPGGWDGLTVTAKKAWLDDNAR